MSRPGSFGHPYGSSPSDWSTTDHTSHPSDKVWRAAVSVASIPFYALVWPIAKWADFMEGRSR